MKHIDIVRIDNMKFLVIHASQTIKSLNQKNKKLDFQNKVEKKFPMPALGKTKARLVETKSCQLNTEKVNKKIQYDDISLRMVLIHFARIWEF